MAKKKCKKALITGVTGQDGAYLAKFLLEKGYEVYGFYRRISSPNFWRLFDLGIMGRIKLISGDMTDMASISNAIIRSRPDEIYNLAAQSFVGTSFEQPLATAEVDGMGVVMLLEAVKQHDIDIRVYHASTSELYGNNITQNISVKTKLTEDDIFWPASPYAASKLYAYHLIRIYREAYKLFAVNGILFNHESPLRGLEFVTRKISNAVARIALGLQDRLTLGNLDAERDWGYAPEYVEAMWLMLQRPNAEDFVVATGDKHSVREFADEAFKCVGMSAKEHIVQSKEFSRPIDINSLIGDSSKAKRLLKWGAKTGFKELVKIMVDRDMWRWKSHMAGKIFAWDAINDPQNYHDGFGTESV